MNPYNAFFLAQFHGEGVPHAPWLHLGSTDLLEAHAPEELIPLLNEVELRVEKLGHTAVGFVCYEAAPAFDSALTTRDKIPGLPLARFLLSPRVEAVSTPAAPDIPPPPPSAEPLPGLASYRRKVETIRERISAGETYQVNLTFPLVWPCPDAEQTARALLSAQPTPYAVWMQGPDWSVASASPELFFRLDGDLIRMRPMKGTRPRGWSEALDLAQRSDLLASPKDRAENVMIVDMVRNDLNRICPPGSVRTTALFEAERYPTVWQMTSTVEGATQAGVADIFRALFPCASVTGAPKASTMAIIREVEDHPRGVYTGAVGVLRPGRCYTFSVGIRTLLLDHPKGTARYGVGSGVVWDSQPEAEYLECLQKAAVLYPPPPAPQQLLETMLYEPGQGVWLLDRHLDRLRSSAAFLGLPDPSPAARRLLAGVHENTPRRLRMLYDPGNLGEPLALHNDPLERLTPPPGASFRIRIDSQPTPSQDLRLYHKSLERGPYAAARARHPDADDVLLWNERGEITETTIANVAVKIGEQWCTPPLACGLLAGCFRAELLEQGWMRERVIRRDEVGPASEIVLVNSVRGKIPARIVA